MLEACIRPIDPQSAKAFADLCARAFWDAYRDVHRREDIEAYCALHYSPERLRRVLADPAKSSCIAVRADRWVGYYLLSSGVCPIALGGVEVELKQIYVLASEYGSGLARTLLDSALQEARAMGAAYVWLVVSDKNRRAQAFYRKLGFVRRGAGDVIEVGEDRLPSSILALGISS